MSAAVKDWLAVCRPRNITGRGDKYLRDVAQELRRLLLKAGQKHLPEAYRLADHQVTALAVALTELGEDLHNDIGLWRTVEEKNHRLFGTPLPFLVKADEIDTITQFDIRRVQYFIWGILLQIHPHMAISVKDPTAVILSRVAAPYLVERFGPIPRDSGVRKWLEVASKSSGEIKNKLIWLSTSSFLFRTAFYELAQAAQVQTAIVAGIFTREHFSVWSGLNPIELFADMKLIAEADRQDIQTWADRSIGLYVLIDREDRNGVCEMVRVRNLFSSEEQRVIVREEEFLAKPGAAISGLTVRWHGDWYWFGHHRIIDAAKVPSEQALKEQFSATPMALEHSPEVIERVRAHAQEFHARFVARHGSDFVELPNGTIAAKEVYMLLSGCTEEEAAAKLEAYCQSDEAEYLKVLSQVTTPVGLFANPSDGPEWSGHFDTFVSALQKGRAELTEPEIKTVYTIMASTDVSPEFVRKFVEKYGAAAIYQTFLLPEDAPEWGLEFLFRFHKAPFYRKRRPRPFMAQFI